MRHDTALTVTSLLAVLLMALHLASDVVLGLDQFDRGMVIGILILAVPLWAAVALRGRRAGYIILLLFSVMATGIPVLHMPAAGLKPEFLVRPGVYLFVFTVLALGATAAVSFALCVQGLWSLRGRVRTM